MPTVSVQKELLRERAGVFNPHNFCQMFNPAEKKVYIEYRPQDNGRAFQGAAWQVHGIGFDTHLGAFWRDQRRKTFDVRGRDDRAAKLAEATAWATEQGYGTEWVRDIFGCYQTAETIALYKDWLSNDCPVILWPGQRPGTHDHKPYHDPCPKNCPGRLPVDTPFATRQP